MASYAIVVGIDQYPKAAGVFPTLSGSRDNALDMVRWLVAAGGVPPDNLRLLLSPDDPADPRPFRPFATDGDAGLRAIFASAATAESIVRTTRAVRDDPATGGGRIYFYFSGHGHQGKIVRVQDAIVPWDYEEDGVLSIRVDSIKGLLQAGTAAEVFLLLDCCRNRTDADAFYPVGHIGDENPDVQDYDCRATNRSHTSVGGMKSFTQVLLAGLKGDGRAVYWDKRQKAYLVRFEKLKAQVKKAFEGQMKDAGIPREDPRFQDPDLRGPANPILAVIPDPASVGRLRLQIVLDPGKAAPVSLVRVYREFPRIDASADNPRVPPPPVEFLLPPRNYMVEVDAPGFKKAGHAVDLSDDPQEETVNLEDDDAASPIPPAAPPLALAPAADPGGASPGPGGVMRAAPGVSGEALAGFPGPFRTARAIIRAASQALGGAGPGPGPRGEAVGPARPQGVPPAAGGDRGPKAANLVVTTLNEFASVEVLDEAGNRLRPGGTSAPPGEHGKSFRFEGLEPGFYQARLLLPEEPSRPQVIALRPGEQKRVLLAPQKLAESRLAQDMVRAADLLPQPGAQQVWDRDTARPFSAPHASSMLNVCAQSLTHRDGPLGGRLQRFGLGQFWNGAPDRDWSGLQALVAAELDDGATARRLASGVEFRLWPMDGPAAAPFRAEPSFFLDGLAGVTLPAEPGPYLLSYKPTGDAGEITFALTVMARHLTVLVFNLREHGELKVYQSIGPLAPGRTEANQRASRRLDILERYYIAGRVDECRDLARSMLESRDLDPVGGSIGAFLFSNRADEQADRAFAAFAALMPESFPSLCDAHVIRAEMLARSGDEAGARVASEQALGLGLPLFGPWVGKLRAAVDRPEIEGRSPRIPLLRAVAQGRIASLPWTAWSPRALETGKAPSLPGP